MQPAQSIEEKWNFIFWKMYPTKALQTLLRRFQVRIYKFSTPFLKIFFM